MAASRTDSKRIFAEFQAQPVEDKVELAAFAKTRVKTYGMTAVHTLSTYEVLALCWWADGLLEDHPRVPKPKAPAQPAPPAPAPTDL